MLPDYELNPSLCAPGPWEGPSMERAVSEACTTLARFNPFPHHFFLASSLFQSRIHPTPDMSDQPELSHLQLFFEAAVQDYKKQTGIALIKHPLVGKLRNCDSVESVTAVLGEQMQAFSGSQEKDKVLKSVEKAVSVLYKFSATANFGQDIGLVRPLIPSQLSRSWEKLLVFATH